MNRKIKRAVLFDIDGTILNSGGAGMEAFMRAAMETFGSSEYMKQIDFHGRTDNYIINRFAEHPDFRNTDKLILEQKKSALRKRYISILEQIAPEYNGVLMPGIHNLVKRLDSEQETVQGLLTGNFYESAFIKLNRFGLGKYFSFGAFGGDAEAREDLPPVAKRRFMETFGQNMDFSRMIIIGDTVHDISCAKAWGAVSAAVGTGGNDKNLLLSRKPDFYFDDLSDTEKVMQAVLSV